MSTQPERGTTEEEWNDMEWSAPVRERIRTLQGELNAAREELVQVKDERDQLQLVFERNRPGMEKAQDLIDGGRWAGHPLIDAVTTELAQARAELAALKARINCHKCEGAGWYMVPWGEEGEPQQQQCEHCGGLGIDRRYQEADQPQPQYLERPMFQSIEDYEATVGYQVNEAFKMGWDMGRTPLPTTPEAGAGTGGGDGAPQTAREWLEKQVQRTTGDLKSAYEQKWCWKEHAEDLADRADKAEADAKTRHAQYHDQWLLTQQMERERDEAMDERDHLKATHAQFILKIANMLGPMVEQNEDAVMKAVTDMVKELSCKKEQAHTNKQA